MTMDCVKGTNVSEKIGGGVLTITQETFFFRLSHLLLGRFLEETMKSTRFLVLHLFVYKHTVLLFLRGNNLVPQ